MNAVRMSPAPGERHRSHPVPSVTPFLHGRRQPAQNTFLKSAQHSIPPCEEEVGPMGCNDPPSGRREWGGLGVGGRPCKVPLPRGGHLLRFLG